MGDERESVVGDGPSPAQAAVQGFGSGRLLVEGAPGTGKSLALDRRLVALAEAGTPRSGVALVVASAGSAEAHRRRLEGMFSGPGDDLVVETVDRFAENICRLRAPDVGLDPDFQVVGRAERLAMLMVRFDSLPLEHHQIRGNPTGLMRHLLGRIDAVKAGLADPPGDDPIGLEVAELIRFHDRMLASIGCLDGTDLCRIATGLAEAEPDGDESPGFAWQHLLVDDAGAFDPVRSRFLDALSGRVDSAVFAYDPVASGAERSGLLADREGDAPRVSLGKAFSTGEDQLRAALAILGPELPDLDWEAGEDGGSIRFWRSPGPRAEAQAVAREVEHLVTEGLEPGSVVIAVGDPNRDGPVVQEALAERAIGTVLESGSAFFREPEVRDTIAWLRALTDPNDAAAVTRTLTRPPVNLKPVDLAHLTVIARRRKIEMVSAAEAALESPRVSPDGRERIGSFLSLYRAAARALDTHRPDAFVRRLIERVGFRREGLFSAQPETAERLLALSRLAEIAVAWGLREPDGTAREFVPFLAALADGGIEVSNGPRVPGEGKVRIVSRNEVPSGAWRRVYLLGCDSAGNADRTALAGAIAAASDEVVLSRLDRPAEPDLQEAALGAVTAIEEIHDEELFGPAEDIHASYRMMRDEVVEASWKVGRGLVEPRLDTPEDINRAVARFLELLKLAALAQRSGGGADGEALDAINGLLAQVATPGQLAELERSTLDPYLLANERDRDLRQRLVEAAAEPSLAAFLPRRGDDLRLSATDLDLYLTCPLKYKFARVFGIPNPPTVNQKFGILIHNVLHRFHESGEIGRDELMAMVDGGWRRSGLGESVDEVQFRERAREALGRYWEVESRSESEPVWLERGFEFRIGPHYLRGRIDRVDRRPDGSYEVIDYKTGKRVVPERLGGDIQLALYRLGIREAWGVEAETVSYYYVLEGEKDSIEVGPDDRERVERTALEVGEGILGQDFEPRPSPATCGWCDFRMVCPAAEA